MLEKFDDSLSAMEDNMAKRLSKIERRLESLETVVSHIDLLQNRLLFITKGTTGVRFKSMVFSFRRFA